MVERGGDNSDRDGGMVVSALQRHQPRKRASILVEFKKNNNRINSNRNRNQKQLLGASACSSLSDIVQEMQGSGDK